MSKVILDTNILIYYSDRRSKFHQSTKTYIHKTQDELFMPSKVIAEYFSVCSKLKIPYTEVFRQYYFFKKKCKLIFVTPKSTATLETLIEKYEPLGNQVYDYEIVSVMIANDIDTIFTFNKKDFAEIEEISILGV